MRILHILTKGRPSFSKAALRMFIALVAVFSFAILPSAALAIDTGLDYGTFTGLSSQDLRITIMQIVRVILGFVGVIAITIIIYAGYLWMTSAGNAEQIDRAKRTLRNAAIGLLIIFLAFAIVSFIINALRGTFGIGNPPGGNPPGGGCENCDFLGSGIIESVYPIPNQRDVSRNTNIIVTFKVPIDPTTIIENGGAGCVNGAGFTGCDGFLVDDGTDGPVLIYPHLEDEDAYLSGNQVRVRTNNARTFVFDPVDLLGNPETDTQYAVKLTNAIRRSNGELTFTGIGSFFRWRFWIGTFLDIDPPEVSSVFPPPDYAGDDYTLSQAQAAQGALSLTAQPRAAQSAAVGITRTSPPGRVCDAASSNPGDACTGDGQCGGGSCISNVVPDEPRLLLSQGPYNGAYEGTLTLTINSPSQASANWSPARANNACVLGQVGNFCSNDDQCDSTPGSGDGLCVFGAPNTFTISNNTITLGDGVILSLANVTVGNQWQVQLTPNLPADTLRIGNLSASRTFTFVDGGAGTNQITIGADVNETTQNVISRVNATPVLPVTATGAGATVNFTARQAGAAGNGIFIQASTRWANVSSMDGGSDVEFQPTTQAVPDQPRNSLIRIDFNETMNPSEFPENTSIDESRIVVEYLGRVCTQGAVGQSCAVDQDCDTGAGAGDGACGGAGNPANPAHWRTAESAVQISNLYRTIELTPAGACLDEQGNQIQNSCGEQISCWPYIDPVNYEATRYRVYVRAANLVDCSGSSCTDSNYGSCAPAPGGNGAYCQGDVCGAGNVGAACSTDTQCDSTPGAGDGYCGIIYPVAVQNQTGAMDASNNSLNGNRNIYTIGQTILGLAQGPGYRLDPAEPGNQSNQPPFSLNKVCEGSAVACTTDADCSGSCVFQPDTQGDDLMWEFYINRVVDLDPPLLVTVGTNVLGESASLTLPVEHTFDTVMRSSTLKPGSNYADGQCGCRNPGVDVDQQGTCAAGQICRTRDNTTEFGTCVVTQGGQCVLGGGSCDPTQTNSCGTTPVCTVTGQTDECANPQDCVALGGSCEIDVCQSLGDSPFLCLQDSECNAIPGVGAQCRNEKYVTLVDGSTVSRVGWWVTSQTFDTDVPADGYGDVTQSRLNHTRFQPVTRYGSEVGSGAQDIYQNCYIPSQGPNGDAGYARCSITTTISCTGDGDCPSGERCESPLVQGRCSANPTPPPTGPEPTGALCSTSAQCGTGETCVPVNLACLTANDIANGKAYCCNGRALTQEQWELSGGLAEGGCYTGY